MVRDGGARRLVGGLWPEQLERADPNLSSHGIRYICPFGAGVQAVSNLTSGWLL